MTQDETNQAEWRDPRNWHGGWLGLYYSRRDSRILVPKRIPWMGYTLNFARPAGALVGILLVLIAAGAVLAAIFKAV